MKIMHNTNKLLTSVTAFALSITPSTAIAQDCNSSEEICNPLAVDSVSGFLGALVDAIMYVSVPIIVIFIIFAGFKFVTAGGNTEDIEQAKRIALYTVIGAAIILGAGLLSDILINTADNLGVDNLN